MQLVVLRLVVLRLLPSSSKSPSRWSVRVSSQSLFEALLKGASGLAIELLQFGVETGKPLLGGLVGRLLVGPLELPSPRFLVLLRQAIQNVLALSIVLCHWQLPLAALDLGSLAEDLVDDLAQALAPVDDADGRVRLCPPRR